MKDLFQQRKTYARLRNIYVKNGGKAADFMMECGSVSFGSSPEAWVRAAEKVARAKVIEMYEKEARLAGLIGEM